MQGEAQPTTFARSPQSPLRTTKPVHRKPYDFASLCILHSLRSESTLQMHRLKVAKAGCIIRPLDVASEGDRGRRYRCLRAVPPTGLQVILGVYYILVLLIFIVNIASDPCQSTAAVKGQPIALMSVFASS